MTRVKILIFYKFFKKLKQKLKNFEIIVFLEACPMKHLQNFRTIWIQKKNSSKIIKMPINTNILIILLFNLRLSKQMKKKLKNEKIKEYYLIILFIFYNEI